MTITPKKILFFTSGWIGGAERVTINISKLLPKDEYSVKFVVVGKSDDVLSILDNAFDYIQIKQASLSLLSLFKIIKVIKEEKCDYVFSSIMEINIPVLIASWLLRKRAIVRNNNTLNILSNRLKSILKIAYHFAYKIVAQQEEMRNEIISELNVCPSKVVVINNPINIDTLVNLSQECSPYPYNETVNILSVGRISPKKAQDDLVKAFAIIKEKIKNASLYLVGPYYEEEEFYKNLIKIVEEKKLKESVFIVGSQDNPYKWMKHCDCYVMSSHLEGLPNALVEAMYLGVPVVGTRCVPVVERIIKDGYNGYIADVGDIEGLAFAIEKSLSLRNVSMTYEPASSKEVCALFN